MSHVSYLTSYYAIIVAGGSGSRMQSAVPKQFLLLNGKPVLMHTVEAFFNSASKPQIIIVLAEAYQSQWAQLCQSHQFEVPYTLVNGGETRFHSVKNAVDSIAGDANALVAVHDAVRPLIREDIINESYKTAVRAGNAIAAVKSRDSIRQLKNGLSVSLLRDKIYLVQTPQTFQLTQLKKAYEQPFDDAFTDDASVVEAAGYPIHLIEGSHLNIKITFPEDIVIAEKLMVDRP